MNAAQTVDLQVGEGEYRPGSLLYFVWTQNRADYENPGDPRLGRDLGALLTAPGGDIFMLKFTYRFNI